MGQVLRSRMLVSPGARFTRRSHAPNRRETERTYRTVMASPARLAAHPLVHQGRQERAVLAVLYANRRRVVGRRELARAAGLSELNHRRCDSVLVGVRRLLGPDSIVTVRSRGWMLAEDATTTAEAILTATPDGGSLSGEEQPGWTEGPSHVGSAPSTRKGSGNTGTR